MCILGTAGISNVKRIMCVILKNVVFCRNLSVFCNPKPQVGAFVYRNVGKVYSSAN